ncbi:hypothetical protein H4N49_08395 [Streptomyces sp. DHE17-7]|nr:hypothetical protein [Streptomyces sp. DHE17-7]
MNTKADDSRRRQDRGGFRGRDDRGGFRGRDDRGGRGPRRARTAGGSGRRFRGADPADAAGGGGRFREERDRDREPIKRLPIPEEVTGDEIDKDVRQELQSLPKTLAEDVARNL